VSDLEILGGTSEHGLATTTPGHDDTHSRGIAELRSALLGIASSRAGAHDAEDAVQEALYRAWAHPDVELDRAAGWLRVVTRNAAVDIARRRGRDVGMLKRIVPHEPVTPDHAEDVVDREFAVTLRALLVRLSPPQREVIGLLARGKALREAAAEMGVSLRAAEAHLIRARRALRTWAS
jgi:RNA polymerase sigma factor (sigma-70 family)